MKKLFSLILTAITILSCSKSASDPGGGNDGGGDTSGGNNHPPLSFYMSVDSSVGTMSVSAGVDTAFAVCYTVLPAHFNLGVVYALIDTGSAVSVTNSYIRFINLKTGKKVDFPIIMDKDGYARNPMDENIDSGQYRQEYRGIAQTSGTIQLGVEIDYHLNGATLGRTGPYLTCQKVTVK